MSKSALGVQIQLENAKRTVDRREYIFLGYRVSIRLPLGLYLKDMSTKSQLKVTSAYFVLLENYCILASKTKQSMHQSNKVYTTRSSSATKQVLWCLWLSYQHAVALLKSYEKKIQYCHKMYLSSCHKFSIHIEIFFLLCAVGQQERNGEATIPSLC